MKRFFSFLVFLFLLCVAVTALWVWKNPRYGTQGFDLRRSVLSMFGRDNTERHRPEKYTVADAPYLNPAEVNVLAAMSRQRVLLAKAVVPSVVSITASRTARGDAPADDPLFRIFHRGMRQAGAVPEGAQGSGAIVSKEGHIVTNNHVIDGMDRIEVKLSDGRRKQAVLIGTDPDTDIAVLKIDADDLQPIPFGDSDAVEVGETVLAIGNPYGLEESVTQGIISAKDRITSERTNALFQIDAALQPGNSGGPLVNVRGELIGINEQIYTETGGWQGVGFAIPAATVRRSMDSILTTGRVIHGYLGVVQARLTSQNAKQHGLVDPKGVLVDRVRVDSPAEKADIRAGDLIEKFNGKPIGDIVDLRRCVDEDVNTTATVELLRDGQILFVKALIAERPPPGSRFSYVPALPRPSGTATPAGGGALDGVKVEELTNRTLAKLGLPGDTQGVVVAGVDAACPAADKLRPGDIIDRINQQAVASPTEYAALSQDLLGGEPALLSVMRSQTRMLVVINPS